MNRDDIIRMAREAGFADAQGTVHAAYQLEHFAALVAAAEREKVAEEIFAMVEEGGWGWDSEGMREHWKKRGQA